MMGFPWYNRVTEEIAGMSKQESVDRSDEKGGDEEAQATPETMVTSPKKP